MKFTILALKFIGVEFTGRPEYIDYDARLDASGGLKIEKGVVISTKVIILTHDWSFLKRLKCTTPANYHKLAFKAVSIGENSFIGAGAIVLPGTSIGSHCIIGAGSVVKGSIPDYSIVIGNPSKIIGDTRK